jgi:hypothetical protein
MVTLGPRAVTGDATRCWNRFGPPAPTLLAVPRAAPLWPPCPCAYARSCPARPKPAVPTGKQQAHPRPLLAICADSRARVVEPCTRSGLNRGSENSRPEKARRLLSGLGPFLCAQRMEANVGLVESWDRVGRSMDCGRTARPRRDAPRHAAVVRSRCACSDRNLSDLEFGRLQKYCSMENGQADPQAEGIQQCGQLCATDTVLPMFWSSDR